LSAGFYTSELPDTTLLEIAQHNKLAALTVRYEFDVMSAKILDLTNPRVAKIWGYDRGEVNLLTRSVGFRAQKAGFDVIRFPSERGPGANLVVLDNFDTLLRPQMIVPADGTESEFNTQFNFGVRR
jgi:hypothetical protein